MNNEGCSTHKYGKVLLILKVVVQNIGKSLMKNESCSLMKREKSDK